MGVCSPVTKPVKTRRMALLDAAWRINEEEVVKILSDPTLTPTQRNKLLNEDRDSEGGTVLHVVISRWRNPDKRFWALRLLLDSRVGVSVPSCADRKK